MTEKPVALSDFELELLLIERDTCQFKAERISEVLNRVGAARGLVDAKAQAPAAKPVAPVELEAAFAALKWNPQEGSHIGSFEIAVSGENDGVKFKACYDALSKAGATIKNRLHGPGYAFGYWIFGPAKIYRQKLKQEPGR